MATITKRGNRWSVQIRRRGTPSRSKTFRTQAEAKAWATIEESKIEQGEHIPAHPQLASITVADILLRYESEVTPTKRSAESEQLRLGRMLKDPMCVVSLQRISSAHIAAYRDRRLTVVRVATVHRELATLRHAFNIARREWGYALPRNPVSDVRLPQLNNARDRRLDDGEYARLMGAVDRSLSPDLRSVTEMAIQTGMRRSEILNLAWRHIDLDRRIAHIPITKSGRPRTIPLTDGAIDILRRRVCRTGRVFETTGNALRLAWVRAVKRAGLVDLHFHDLRHEAISRFFELGLSLPEVALISGHRDPRMLLRYTHLRPTDLAEKLAGRSWQSGCQAEEIC